MQHLPILIVYFFKNTILLHYLDKVGPMYPNLISFCCSIKRMIYDRNNCSQATAYVINSIYLYFFFIIYISCVSIYCIINTLKSYVILSFGMIRDFFSL